MEDIFYMSFQKRSGRLSFRFLLLFIVISMKVCFLFSIPLFLFCWQLNAESSAFGSTSEDTVSRQREPEQETVIKPNAKGVFILEPETAKFRGRAANGRTFKNLIEYMDSRGAAASWTIQVASPGDYMVNFVYTSNVSQNTPSGSERHVVQQPYEMNSGVGKVTWLSKYTGGWNNRWEDKIGPIPVEAGRQTFSIVTQGNGAVNFGTVRLIPCFSGAGMPLEVIRMAQAYHQRKSAIAEECRKNYLAELEEQAAQCQREGRNDVAAEVKREIDRVRHMDPIGLMEGE